MLMDCTAKVVNLQKDPGQTYSKDELKAALEQHKPAVLFLTQVRHFQLQWRLELAGAVGNYWIDYVCTSAILASAVGHSVQLSE